MISMEVHEGRLVEIRFSPPITEEEIARFIQQARENPARFPGAYVVCVETSQLKLLTPPLVDKLVELMRPHNPKVERQAFLLRPGSAISFLQVDRMIREAGSSARRAFTDEESLKQWLGEVLTPAERARLGRFLAQG
jgi:hypothetical protein